MSDLRTTFAFKPKPTVSGSWAALRGHWLPVSKDYEISAAWRTVSDDEIGNCFSEGNRYNVDPSHIRCKEKLFMGMVTLPIENQTPLQRRIYDFFSGAIRDTNHPFARWGYDVHGIRVDSRGVYSQYDIMGYRFMNELDLLNESDQPDSEHAKMLRMAWRILLKPGHYAALVEELYPDSVDSDERDPLDATYLTPGRRFRPESYSEVDYKAVVHYLKGELKIPRIATRYNLEPFVRLVTSIDIASRVMAQIDLQNTVEDSAPWSRKPTFLEASYGRRCRVIQPVLFNCGPFPLRDLASGPVCWQIPPPSLRDAVAEV